MELQPVVDFVKSVGFPGAIAIFVLWRLEPILRDLVAEIRAFRESTVVSTGALKEHVTETGDRVIREVGHDVRNALNTLSMRRD